MTLYLCDTFAWPSILYMGDKMLSQNQLQWFFLHYSYVCNKKVIIKSIQLINGLIHLKNL